MPEAWAMLGGPYAIAWRNIKVGHVDIGYSEHPAFGFPGSSWIDQATPAPSCPIRRSADPPIDQAMLPSAEPGGAVTPWSAGSAGHGMLIGATIRGHAPGAAVGAFHGVAPKVPRVPVHITDSVWINLRQRAFRDAGVIMVCAAGNIVNPRGGAGEAEPHAGGSRCLHRTPRAGIPLHGANVCGPTERRGNLA